MVLALMWCINIKINFKIELSFIIYLLYLRAKEENQVSEKKKILFLINPKSGTGGKHSVPRLVRSFIDKEKYDVLIKETRYVAHACELAKEAVADGVDVVVAVGGDGTVNEVARSLIGSSVALGIIPCGSGNGLARHLGIPLDCKKAVEFLNNAVPVAVDYGKINGSPFFCTCGIGFDALVSSSFARGTRRGLWGYMNQTLTDWLNYEPEVYEIESESFKKDYKAFLIACGNAAQYGNNAYISPNASMRDGLLSVTILEPFPATDVPLILGQLFGRTLTRNGHIKTFEAKWLKIKRKAAGPVHFDGEPADMDAELFIEMVPQGLNVMASPDWNGCSVVVPLYKQLAELVSVSVSEIEAELPKMDINLPKMDISFPKIEIPFPKVSDIVDKLPPMPSFAKGAKGLKRRSRKE